MRFEEIFSALASKTGAIFTLEGGKPVRHSYVELSENIGRARERLRRWGVTTGTRVGIYAPNSYHWLVYDLALIAVGAVSVPFTEDFGGKIDQALLDKYRVSLLLISKSAEKAFPDRAFHIAFLDAENDGISAAHREKAGVVDDEDCLSLAFSSGSAGGLKGLVISRRGAESTLPPIVESIGVMPGDRLLLFLPMSNFQQRMMCYSALWYDFDIIVVEYAQLFLAIKQLQPTVLIAPPLLYQMLHARFAAVAAVRWIWLPLGRLISCLPAANIRRWLARRLFGAFYQQFGGKIRLLITGMAPIGRATDRFFAAMQLPLAESYGLVETGSLTYRPPGTKMAGSVGKPLAGIHLSFAADGEIIVHREYLLTSAYFESAEGENEKTFLGQGRVATGDIGRLDAKGYLRLRGRKKEIIVTPAGYKIHPEVLEEEINAFADVAQSVVFQRPGAAHLICVLVLNEGRPEGAEKRIRTSMDNMAIAKKIRIGDVIVAVEPFSRENGLLRPNLKINRRGVEERYRAQAVG